MVFATIDELDEWKTPCDHIKPHCHSLLMKQAVIENHVGHQKMNPEIVFY